MAREGMTKCREQFDPLLAQSRKVTADAAEHRNPIFGAEATRDLLLDFDHAQISLRLVVGLSRQLHVSVSSGRNFHGHPSLSPIVRQAV